MAKGKKTGGRHAGTPNKVTASIKEVYEKVFHELQLTDKISLLGWARQNPTEFYKLSAKLLPAEVNAKVQHTTERIEVVRMRGEEQPLEAVH